MYKLFEFIRSTYLFFLFVVIEIIALSCYAHSTYYTQAKLLSSSNAFIGGGYRFFTNIDNYFSLSSANEILLNRVIELESELILYESAEVIQRLSSYMEGDAKTEYELMPAHVISNTVNRLENFIILNKGTDDGVVIDMVVLSADGALVGYIIDCSGSYSVALSIISTSFKSSGKVAEGEGSSSILWSGKSKYQVTMDALSKYADPQIGDEIVSTNSSKNLNLPKDILIGYVVDKTLNETKTSYMVEVELAADITNLIDVILVRNSDADEINSLKADTEVKYKANF